MWAILTRSRICPPCSCGSAWWSWCHCSCSIHLCRRDCLLLGTWSACTGLLKPLRRKVHSRVRKVHSLHHKGCRCGCRGSECECTCPRCRECTYERKFYLNIFYDLFFIRLSRVLVCTFFDFMVNKPLAILSRIFKFSIMLQIKISFK